MTEPEFPYRPPQQTMDAWKSVGGWLSRLDLYAMDLMLAVQTSVGIQGDILEIGSYLGKSTVVLANRIQPHEVLTVCDNFGFTESADNLREIQRSYAPNYRSTFDANLEKFSRRSPVVHAMDSRHLMTKVEPNSCRFVHVDGSHLFEYVASDLATALVALSDSGIVVVDDYRSQHTPGVSYAFWQNVSAGRLQPFLLTSRKAYCCRFGTNPGVLNSVERMLDELCIPFLRESLGEVQVIATMESDEQWGFASRRLADMWLPPVVAKSLRNCKAMLSSGLRPSLGGNRHGK